MRLVLTFAFVLLPLACGRIGYDESPLVSQVPGGGDGGLGLGQTGKSDASADGKHEGLDAMPGLAGMGGLTVTGGMGAAGGTAETGGTSGSGGMIGTGGTGAGGNGGSAGVGGNGGMNGTAGTGGQTPVTIGCADGDREGFPSPQSYPDIAGCSGGWSLPGLQGDPAPACDRVSGDDSTNPSGTGCSASDLCASGWHVCRDKSEVAARAGDCTGVLASGTTTPLFFATAQSSGGSGNCDTLGANDLFGCGNLGNRLVRNCAPLQYSSSNRCSSLGVPWDCPSTELESQVVVKTGDQGGGVLCCRD